MTDMKKIYKLINVPQDCTGDFGIERIKDSISSDGTMAFGVCRNKLDDFFMLHPDKTDTEYWVEISDKPTRYGYEIKRDGKAVTVDGESVIFFTTAAELLRTILKNHKVYYVSMWQA